MWNSKFLAFSRWLGAFRYFAVRTKTSIV